MTQDYVPGDVIELPETYAGLDFLEPVEELKDLEKSTKMKRASSKVPLKYPIEILKWVIAHLKGSASC